MKEKHFFLDVSEVTCALRCMYWMVLLLFFQKEWTFINHGAFGAALKEGHQAETVT